MPFLEHLGELRTRLFNALLGVVIASVITITFRNELYLMLVYPLDVAWKQTFPGTVIQLHALSPVEVFMAPFKTALFAAILVGSPVVFYQMWAFIAPGLYPRERRYVVPFVVAAVGLFVGGAAFCYLYVLPASLKFFLQIFNDPAWSGPSTVFGHSIDLRVVHDAVRVTPMITLDEYLSLTLMLLLVFGVVFELPMVLSVLAMVGIVTPKMLWDFNRYAVLISFVAGAVLTPGDLVVGQIAMGCSLTVLYNLSILAAFLVGRRRPAPEEAAAGGPDDKAKAAAT